MKRIHHFAPFTVCTIILVSVAIGCSQPAPKGISDRDTTSERSALPSPHGSWDLADGSKLILEDRALRLEGSNVTARISTELIGHPSVNQEGTRVAFSSRQERSYGSQLATTALGPDGWSSPKTIVDEGTPDRVSISPDGKRVAYVAPANGVSAIWIIPFHGGESVQVTNNNLKKSGRGEPDVFVPVPHRAPPRFAGNKLVWESPDGRHEVVLS